MSKVVFIGTSDFGLPTLDYLKKNHELSLVVTQPDKPAGRKKIMTAPAVKVWAQFNGTKFLQPNKIEDEIEALKQTGADIFIVGAFGQIIPQNILDIPKQGSLNLHTSLLPKYRGASPIQNAIMNGDKQTGITIIKMDDKMDHGPIIAQAAIEILPKDNYSTLHQKLAELAAKLLSDSLPDWLAGKIQPVEQNHELATFVKLLTRNDARIDWTQPAKAVANKIKALNPEPGTWTTLAEKSVKIIDADAIAHNPLELAGTIFLYNKNCLVKCGSGSVILKLAQPEGKKPITGEDFINGLKNSETKVFV